MKIERRGIDMRKSLLIAASNLRRAKGQTVAIIALILLASAALNLWLMLSQDYKRNFDRYHDKLNAEHVTLVLSSRDSEMQDFVIEALEEDSRTVQYHIDDVLCMVGDFEYNGGEVNTEFVILEKEAALNRPVGKVEIVEEGEYTSGIYLPMLYGTEGNLEVGEQIDITIGSNTMRYTVCGFLNSVMAGSHNCSMSALLLTADCYRELEELGYAPASTMVSVRIRDKEESEGYEADLKNKVSGRYPGVRTLSNAYSLVKSSRYISQMICAGIVSAMAFFVTVITLVVIASNVVNDIQENMRNLGALKAIGYKSTQIVSGLLLQFLGMALLTAFLGSGLSYCLFPAVNGMMIAQTGIPYSVRFLPVPFFMTLLIIGGAVALAVWLSARRIREIEPVTALRQGVLTHNFKRNHVPLDRTGMPLQLAMALKTTLSGVKQNVTVCVAMLVLSLVVVFAGVMLENFIMDMEPFINMVVGEVADSCINVSAGAEDAFLEIMETEKAVEKAYLYSSIEVAHGEGEGSLLVATVSEDFSRVNNQSVCFEGRFPRYENEVALGGKYAGEKKLKVGDEITLAAAGREEKYLICGLTQISNNLGKDCLLTRSGYERMGKLDNLSYYIDIAEGEDIDAFNKRVGERLGMDVNASINILSVVEGSSSVYVSLMTVIVAAVLVLSGAVVVFVLYLLVRALLNRKKRDYGILKALGFTTGQLVVQTAGSFMPAVVLSAMAGLAVSACIINPLTALFLRGIGIVKCTFTVPVGFVIAAGVGLVFFTFGITCLLSLRIRKNQPVALLAGE